MPEICSLYWNSIRFKKNISKIRKFTRKIGIFRSMSRCIRPCFTRNRGYMRNMGEVRARVQIGIVLVKYRNNQNNRKPLKCWFLMKITSLMKNSKIWPNPTKSNKIFTNITLRNLKPSKGSTASKANVTIKR